MTVSLEFHYTNDSSDCHHSMINSAIRRISKLNLIEHVIRRFRTDSNQPHGTLIRMQQTRTSYFKTSKNNRTFTESVVSDRLSSCGITLPCHVVTAGLSMLTTGTHVIHYLMYASLNHMFWCFHAGHRSENILCFIIFWNHFLSHCH